MTVSEGGVNKAYADESIVIIKRDGSWLDSEDVTAYYLKWKEMVGPTLLGGYAKLLFVDPQLRAKLKDDDTSTTI